MNTPKTETIRLEYRLPSQPGNHYQGVMPNEFTRFPDDRAEQERRNKQEFMRKSAAGLLRRRAA